MLLLARNRPGDREKALELLGEALSAGERLGLEALADKARPLKLAPRRLRATGGYKLRVGLS
jgi:hypothetical protein